MDMPSITLFLDKNWMGPRTGLNSTNSQMPAHSPITLLTQIVNSDTTRIFNETNTFGAMHYVACASDYLANIPLLHLCTFVVGYY
jgi:hypothetical protein